MAGQTESFAPSPRQQKVKIRARAGFARASDAAAVRHDDLTRDRETETGAALGLARGTIKPVKYPRDALRRDARPLIPYRKSHEPQRRARRGERDHAAGRRELRRVGEQVDKHVTDADGVHRQPAEPGFALHLEFRAGPRDKPACFVGDLLQQGRHGHLDPVERDGPGLKA